MTKSLVELNIFQYKKKASAYFHFLIIDPTNISNEHLFGQYVN